MSDPFPAIAEASAAGETADLFADIRATVGVRVVNLVWRHLATLDGALPWAWQAVKPLYLQGMADRAVRRFSPRHDLADAGLAGGRRSRPASMRCWRATTIPTPSISSRWAPWSPGCAARWPPRARRSRGRACRRPTSTCRRSRPKPMCSPETWQRVLRLNRFGDRPEPLILASMYRHLAHAPAIPAAPGSRAGAGAGRRLARPGHPGQSAGGRCKRARVLARAIAADRPRLGRADRSRRCRPSSSTPSARW